MLKKLLFLGLLASLAWACAQSVARPKRTFPKLLSAQEAKPVLLDDTGDAFFANLTPLEMEIQLRRSLAGNSREQALGLYQTHIQADLRDFTPEESKRANAQIQRALQLCYKINPRLPLPDTVYLLKTEGNYYGGSVYYTRNKSIVIPAPQLEAGNEENLMSTLIHELFHIYSRFNPKKRDALYARIGFEKIPSLELNDFLKTHVFYNPDATDMRYKIRLKTPEGDTVDAIPAIYSRFGSYRSDVPSFFNYLVFQLFPVQRQPDGGWKVSAADVGLSPDAVRGFYEQVGRNTMYIIHPEEILADNFKLLALSKDPSTKALLGLDENGLKLIEDIEQILTSE